MFMLILLLLLCSSSNTHEEHDLKGFMDLNNTDINTDLTKLLLQLVIDMRSELKEYVKKENMRSELKEYVKKDELPELMETITPSPEPMNEQTKDIRTGPSFMNMQYRTPGAPFTTEAPVVPFANMSSMDQLLKLLVPRSCYGWRQNGFTVSGTYLIDPDGQGVGDPPVRVYCDMLTGFTFLRHDMEGMQNTTTCTGPMCYKAKMTYGASEMQIQTLIMASERCQQFVKVECYDSPFQTDDEPLAYWKGRDGLRHYEWAGDDYPNHACACGLLESCVNPMKSCHCDSGIPNVWVSDSGYVTNHSALPIQEVAFGTKDQYTPLQLMYSVGPLRCYGSRSLSYPTSCLDTFLRGSVTSGWYILGNPKSLRFTYCEMNPYAASFAEQNSSLDNEVEPPKPVDVEFSDLVVKSLQRKGYVVLREKQLNEIIQNTVEQQHNITDIKNLIENNEQRWLDHSFDFQTLKSNVTNLQKHVVNSHVVFHADSHEKWSSNIIIKYEHIRINHGNGYDSSTGKFTAPVAGIYYIAAYGRQGKDHQTTWFIIRKNENKINLAESQTEQYTSLGIAVIVDLKVGDEVDVYLNGGSIYSNSYDGASFQGFLIYET